MTYPYYFFTDVLRPIFSMSVALLNTSLFGFAVWQHLLGFIVLSFVVGFIVKGNGFNGSFISSFSSRRRGEKGSSSHLDSSEWIEHSDSQFYYDD